MNSPRTLNVAIVGTGGITLQNHLPGLALCPDVKVHALCDANAATLETARQHTGAPVASTNWQEVVTRDDIHAVIIATPNFLHPDIAITAARHGKHVLSEKPLALNADDAQRMADEADKANVRHMTAFTYRFVPAMRYAAHLIGRGDLGRPYHYRSCRLQDFGRRALGWRQVKALAGTGELGDMLSHRIDFANLLVGPMLRLVAQLKRFVDDRSGQPSDLDDCVSILAEFVNGATGVLQSSKLATGRRDNWHSPDSVEVNGESATLAYDTRNWNELQFARPDGKGLQTVSVPREFWVWPGSPRDPGVGDPLVSFRYDQAIEFINAIREQRPCAITFHDGAKAQRVMDAAVKSAAIGQWVELA